LEMFFSIPGHQLPGATASLSLKPAAAPQIYKVSGWPRSRF
jgi:hypothetical protein